MGIKIIYRAIIDRRKSEEAVPIERRIRLRARDAEHSLREAIERLSAAIKLKRPDIIECGADTVTFVTFSEVCDFRAHGLKMRLCRNKKHKSAGGLAECNENECPFMLGRA